MKCYRKDCKEECDDLKIKYCILKISEKEHQLHMNIHKGSVCEECGELLIKAKYKGKGIKLCTRCGQGLERKYRKCI